MTKETRHNTKTAQFTVTRHKYTSNIKTTQHCKATAHGGILPGMLFKLTYMLGYSHCEPSNNMAKPLTTVQARLYYVHNLYQLS